MLLSGIDDLLILFSLFLAILCIWFVAGIPFRTVFSFFKGLFLIFIFLIFFSSIFSRVSPKAEMTYIELIPSFIPLIGGSGIYYEIFLVSLSLSFRTLSLLSLAVLVSLTTEPSKMIYVLRALRCPYELAIMAIITIRFIPIILEHWKKLNTVAKVRGMETAGIRGRISAAKKLSTPLIMHSVRRSTHLAYSLDARGFRAVSNPTTMEKLELKFLDYLILLLSALMIILYVLIMFGIFSIPNIFSI